MLVTALLLLVIALFVSVIVAGTIAAGYYWRGKYEAISERMHNAIPLIDAGEIEKARELLLDH